MDFEALFRRAPPRRCAPTAALAAVIGSGKKTRVGATQRLWKYIRDHDLQSKVNPRMILCDAALKGVTGLDEVTLFQLNAAVSAHLRETDDTAPLRDPDAHLARHLGPTPRTVSQFADLLAEDLEEMRWGRDSVRTPVVIELTQVVEAAGGPDLVEPEALEAVVYRHSTPRADVSGTSPPAAPRAPRRRS